MASVGSLTARTNCPACGEEIAFKAVADDLPTPDGDARLTFDMTPVRDHIAAAHPAADPEAAQ